MAASSVLLRRMVGFLAWWRYENLVSQRKLAEQAHLAISVIVDMEGLKTAPTTATLEAYAAGLGLQVDLVVRDINGAVLYDTANALPEEVQRDLDRRIRYRAQ